MSDTFDLNFLALEFGGRVSPDGEPLGMDFRELRFDQEIRQIAWRAWQDYQRSVKNKPQALAEAGLTPVDLWKPGISETLETCSSEEELRRYRMKLTLRADFLEALLEETLSELDKANRAKPTEKKPESDG